MARMSDMPVRTGLPRQRILAVVAVTLATATVSFDSSIPNVALPTIARELGVAGSSAVSFISTYQIILVITLLPFAALAERIDALLDESLAEPGAVGPELHLLAAAAAVVEFASGQDRLRERM